jgi:hypothetical protein
MNNDSPFVPTVLLASLLEGLTACALHNSAIAPKATRKCGHCAFIGHDRCNCPSNKEIGKFVVQISTLWHHVLTTNLISFALYHLLYAKCIAETKNIPTTKKTQPTVEAHNLTTNNNDDVINFPTTTQPTNLS